MSSGVEIPSPVGGVPFSIDLAPSILFAALYAVLAGVGVWRFACRSTRTVVSIGNVIFVLERVATFTLRAVAAKHPSLRLVKGVVNYGQITLASGYITMLNNATRALQSLVVGATIGDEFRATAEAQLNPNFTPAIQLMSMGSSATTSAVLPEEPAEKDLPEARARYRRWFGLNGLLNLVTLILAIIVGNSFAKAETDADKAKFVRTVRFAENGMGLVLVIILQGISLWAFFFLPRIRRKDGALLMFGVSLLLQLLSTYRLVVIPNTTPSLLYTGPGSLNMPRDKAVFYVFHAAPEFLTAAVLVCVDIRGTFGTGLWGDRFSGSKPRKYLKYGHFS